MKNLILLTFVALMANCTTTKYVDKIVEVPKVETVYEAKVQKDSIYLKDSVYIHQRGDTVWSERWHTKFVERLRVDTFIKRDSIHVPVEVRTTVEKEPTRWEKMKQDSFVYLIGIIAILCAIIYGFINKQS